MKKSRFPKGWDETRVQRLIEYYDKQTAEQAAAEEDKIFNPQSSTVIRVPRKLIPKIRKLIAQYVG